MDFVEQTSFDCFHKTNSEFICNITGFVNNELYQYNLWVQFKTLFGTPLKFCSLKVNNSVFQKKQLLN